MLFRQICALDAELNRIKRRARGDEKCFVILAAESGRDLFQGLPLVFPRTPAHFAER